MKTHAIGSRLPALALAGAAILAFSSAPAFSQAGASKPAAAPLAFDTPGQAADAAVKAAADNDVAALKALFGEDGKYIVPSGDPVKDKNDLASFAEKAHQKMEISFDVGDPKRAVLVVGEEEWPMPVPIVEKGGKWRFDAKQGREEILARRIGGNELDAISLLRGYVEAQEDYAAELHDGAKMHQYAQKAISTPGKHDGLSWRNEDGTIGGPIGDEVAKALAAGYTSRLEPYNGYYFRTLTAQGPAAPPGARDYIVNGMMIGGFAAIAWPVTYGVTGIQTFQVNNDGLVYQKDLGPDTGRIAPTIKRYNPDNTWLVTEDEP